MGRAEDGGHLHDARRAGALTHARWHRVLPALLVGGFLLAGCPLGHKNDGPLLRVGTSGDYPPFSLARENGVEGFDIAVAQRFADDTGRRVQFVPFRWPDLAAALAAGRFDVAMGGITMRPERTFAGSYTRPVVETGAVVLVRPGVARTATDVDRRAIRLGVNAGGHLERVARRLFSHALIQPINDNLALAAQLDMGAVDAIVMDDLEADLVLQRVTEAWRLGPLTRDHKAYLGRDPVLVAELDAWLGDREADGWLTKLRAQWFGEARATPRSRAESERDALVTLLDLRLAFMPMVAAAKERSGLAIEDPAQEQRVLETARARARELGLDPESVAALFRSQLAAGRAVQRAYLMTPAPQRWAVEAAGLADQLRPALARVSDAILVRAAEVMKAPERKQLLSASVVVDGLDPMLTPATLREDIGRAVAALRPGR